MFYLSATFVQFWRMYIKGKFMGTILVQSFILYIYSLFKIENISEIVLQNFKCGKKI